MKSLSSIGLGLSVLFGCLVLAFVAEIYYLLWWKKRIARTEIEENYSNPAKEFLHPFCWKRRNSLSRRGIEHQDMRSVIITDTLDHNSDAHFNKDLFVKPFDEEGAERELMGVHNYGGPPRFLFTILEETGEDLDSEDGNSKTDNGNASAKGSRSLSDLVLTVDTPFLTPLASPPFFTPPLTPMGSSWSPYRSSPRFESLTDAEFNRIKSSSPSPKFKFLRDAEEKLRRKIMEEADKKSVRSHNFSKEVLTLSSSTSSRHQC